MTPTIIDGQRYCLHVRGIRLAVPPEGDDVCPWCIVENLRAERAKDQAVMREAVRLNEAGCMYAAWQAIKQRIAEYRE